jgi:hypothetical protein
MTTKVYIMIPIKQEIKDMAQLIENARLADDTEAYEQASKTHHILTVQRNLGLNFMKIPVGTN